MIFKEEENILECPSTNNNDSRGELLLKQLNPLNSFRKSFNDFKRLSEFG